MSHILDDSFTELGPTSKCKRLRSYILLFSGLMACIALIIKLLNLPYAYIFLIIGMMAITFQSHYCFYHKHPKKWPGLIRVIIITLITAYAIIQVLLPSFL